MIDGGGRMSSEGRVAVVKELKKADSWRKVNKWVAIEREEHFLKEWQIVKILFKHNSGSGR